MPPLCHQQVGQATTPTSLFRSPRGLLPSQLFPPEKIVLGRAVRAYALLCRVAARRDHAPARGHRSEAAIGYGPAVRHQGREGIGESVSGLPSHDLTVARTQFTRLGLLRVEGRDIASSSGTRRRSSAREDLARQRPGRSSGTGRACS
jgi:hypothetical protein